MIDGNMFRCTTWIESDFTVEFKDRSNIITLQVNFGHGTALRTIRDEDSNLLGGSENLGVRVAGDILWFWMEKGDEPAWMPFDPKVQEAFKEHIAEMLLLANQQKKGKKKDER